MDLLIPLPRCELCFPYKALRVTSLSHPLDQLSPCIPLHNMSYIDLTPLFLTLSYLTHNIHV